MRLESAVQRLRSYRQAYYAPFSVFKDDIYLAINTFGSPQREQLLETYKDCISASNTRPDSDVGNLFTLACKGISDWQFLTATVDLVKKTVTVNIEGGIAHHYFPEVYAAMRYDDADGNTLFHYEVIGSEARQASSVVLPISGYGGEVIHLHHEEPNNRLVITNEMQQVRLGAAGKQQTYCITPVGLARIAD